MSNPPKAKEIKIPRAAVSETAYTRQRDGLRFETTVRGKDKGRCTGCLVVVTIDPPNEAEAHVCVPWWEKDLDKGEIEPLNF